MYINSEKLIRQIYHDGVNLVNPVKEILKLKFPHEEITQYMILNLIQVIDTLKNGRILAHLNENKSFENTNLKISEVIDEIINEIEDNYFFSNKKIIFKKDGEIEIYCNKLLLETLLYNLIHNAFRFGNNCVVSLDKNFVIIENTYTLEKSFSSIFDLPLKSDNFGITGSGLGLVAVKALIDLLSFNLKSIIDEKGVKVVLNF